MDLTSTILQAYNTNQAQLDAQAKAERAKETRKYIIYGVAGLVLFAIVVFSIGKLKNK